MKIIDITEKYNDKKLYNITDVVKEFPTYFNMSLEELEFYFKNYFIIPEQELIDYLKEIYNNDKNLNNIEKERLQEYKYYQKKLATYSSKALIYLSLINYLCNCNEFDNKEKHMEMLLEEVEIFHYSSILVGEDIKRLLVVLYHSLKELDDTLDQINEKTKFKDSRLNPLFILEEFGPSTRLLITGEDYKIDKTSLITKKRIR